MTKIQTKLSNNDSVAHITLNDGKGNVLDAEMMSEILAALNDFKSNKNLKLITFTGEGEHFSFGASVEEHTKEKCNSMLKSFHQLFFQVIELGIPTASIVSGQCLGGGMELALITNFIFADRTAVFGQPEIILGVFPPPASLILPMKIGQAKADDLLITGRSIKAERAYEYGLINRIYDDKDTMITGVNEWIGKHITTKSASSLKFAVKTARSIFNSTLLNHLPQLEKYYNEKLMTTNDANEGINSFIEKRKPNWTNE